MKIPMNCSSFSPSVDVFHKNTDPLGPKGVRHDFHGILILVFLGQLAQLPYIVWTYRWAKLVRDHWQIKNSLHFVKGRYWDEDRALPESPIPPENYS